jgi:hypothetical protein
MYKQHTLTPRAFEMDTLQDMALCTQILSGRLFTLHFKDTHNQSPKKSLTFVDDLLKMGIKNGSL